MSILNEYIKLNIKTCVRQILIANEANLLLYSIVL
jgi:hypothetical protein